MIWCVKSQWATLTFYPNLMHLFHHHVCVCVCQYFVWCSSFKTVCFWCWTIFVIGVGWCCSKMIGMCLPIYFCMFAFFRTSERATFEWTTQWCIFLIKVVLFVCSRCGPPILTMIAEGKAAWSIIIIRATQLPIL